MENLDQVTDTAAAADDQNPVTVTDTAAPDPVTDTRGSLTPAMNAAEYQQYHLDQAEKIAAAAQAAAENAPPAAEANPVPVYIMFQPLKVTSGQYEGLAGSVKAVDYENNTVTLEIDGMFKDQLISGDFVFGFSEVDYL